MLSLQLSKVFWNFVALFVDMFSLVLEFRPGLLFKRAVIYAVAIRKKGAMLQHCVGIGNFNHFEILRPPDRKLYSVHGTVDINGFTF